MMEEELGLLLQERGWHISAAESCTGGMVQARIVNVPGSSAWFEQGYVTYANRAKRDLLGVREETLADFGAVSEECAREMAEGCAAAAGAECALAVTGIAGPDGGTPEKPVGLVWMAFTAAGKTAAEVHRFAGDRQEVRAQAAEAALALACRELSKESQHG